MSGKADSAAVPQSRSLPRAFWSLLVLITATLSAPPRADSVHEALRSVTPINFDSGGAISRQFHLHAESYLRSATMHRRQPPRELPVATRPDLAAAPVKHRFGTTAFSDYVQRDPLIDAVLILHRGRVVYEAYPNMQPWQRHYAWSVSKVLTATALAVLAAQQRVDMAAPVERYVPELAGSAWEGTALLDIVNMASGIACLDSDGYQDSSTCVYSMEESLGITAPTGRNPDFIAQLRGMRRHRAANTRHEYVSANTQVLALVIENVTSMPYTEAVEALVWRHLGVEADALMSINKQGYAYASGGWSLRLRDLARFGQVFTPAGLSVLSMEQVLALPEQSMPLPVDETGATAPTDRATRAGWQWDLIWDDGAMYKAGYLGQGLYVDPRRELVLAWFGTGLDYNEQVHELLPITRQLVRDGLFDGDKPR